METNLIPDLRFELPEELQLYRAGVRRFVDRELIPLEASYKGHFDRAIVPALRAKAQQAGLWLIDAPEEEGGQGLSNLAQAVFWEEISRSPTVPPRNFEVFGPMLGPILSSLQGELRQRYVLPVLSGERKSCFAQTEADAGSDPSRMRTRAVRDGDHWRISGVKRFITDAKEADFCQLMAVTDPDKGAKGISCFLVDLDLPGVRITAEYETMMGDKPCEIVFDDVRVPVDRLVGGEGQGFRLGQEWITRGRIFRHGARSVGVAERCLELGASYAKQRVTFGEPLANRQAVQFMLADTYAEMQQVRMLVWRAAQALDAGGDARMDSWLAKTYGTEMGFRAADRCMQIHGGMGLTTDLPIERMWREQRSFVITEGPAEVMRMAIARQVLDQYA